MKTISLLALLLCIAPCLTAEGNKMTGVGMLSINNMINSYGFTGGRFSSVSPVTLSVDFEAELEFGEIEGDVTIDTPEEFLTATYFSPIEIQDAQARIRIQEVLPQDNPSVAGARLGAMWYQKLVAYQFATGDTPESREQIARYELIMNTISERTGATRAEMVATFRAGVREIVAEKVEREFNKISFVIDMSGNMVSSYTSALTRDAQTGHYTLEYGGYFADNPEQRQVKELTATSLEALLAQMGRSSDFNQATIAVVRDRAEVIPGVVYGKWVDLVMVVNPLDLITEAITQLYLEPNDDNFMLVSRLYANYSVRSSQFPEARMAMSSLYSTLEALGSRLLSSRLTNHLTLYGQSNLVAMQLPGNYSMLFNYGMDGGLD